MSRILEVEEPETTAGGGNIYIGSGGPVSAPTSLKRTAGTSYLLPPKYHYKNNRSYNPNYYPSMSAHSPILDAEETSQARMVGGGNVYIGYSGGPASSGGFATSTRLMSDQELIDEEDAHLLLQKEEEDMKEEVEPFEDAAVATKKRRRNNYNWSGRPKKSSSQMDVNFADDDEAVDKKAVVKEEREVALKATALRQNMADPYDCLSAVAKQVLGTMDIDTAEKFLKTRTRDIAQAFAIWRKKEGMAELIDRGASCVSKWKAIVRKAAKDMGKEEIATASPHQNMADPFDSLSPVAKKFLGTIDIDMAEKFLTARTCDIAQELVYWRKKKGMRVLQDGSADKIVNQWKAVVRKAATDMGKEEVEPFASAAAADTKAVVGNKRKDRPKAPTASSRQRIADPFYCLDAVAKKVLGTMGINTAEKFLNTRTRDIAHEFVYWRKKEGMVKIQDKSATNTVTKWKANVRKSAKAFGKEGVESFVAAATDDTKAVVGNKREVKSKATALCQKMADPFDRLSAATKMFLGTMDIDTAEKFLKTRTCNIAHEFVCWRKKEGMAELKAWGANNTVSTWKTIVRNAAKDMGKGEIAAMDVTHFDCRSELKPPPTSKTLKPPPTCTTPPPVASTHSLRHRHPIDDGGGCNNNLSDDAKNSSREDERGDKSKVMNTDGRVPFERVCPHCQKVFMSVPWKDNHVNRFICRPELKPPPTSKTPPPVASRHSRRLRHPIDNAGDSNKNLSDDVKNSSREDDGDKPKVTNADAATKKKTKKQELPSTSWNTSTTAMCKKRSSRALTAAERNDDNQKKRPRRSWCAASTLKDEERIDSDAEEPSTSKFQVRDPKDRCIDATSFRDDDSPMTTAVKRDEEAAEKLQPIPLSPIVPAIPDTLEERREDDPQTRVMNTKNLQLQEAEAEAKNKLSLAEAEKLHAETELIKSDLVHAADIAKAKKDKAEAEAKTAQLHLRVQRAKAIRELMACGFSKEDATETVDGDNM